MWSARHLGCWPRHHTWIHAVRTRATRQELLAAIGRFRRDRLSQVDHLMEGEDRPGLGIDAHLQAQLLLS